MMMSPEFKEIAAALAKAQGLMTQATMDAENLGFKRDGKAMRYASLAAVLDAVRPHLSANGIAVVQSLETADKDLRVQTMLIHVSGEYVSNLLTVPLAQVTPQAIGSAATYAKRYSLMALCGIASADDDDDGEGATRDITAMGDPTSTAHQGIARVNLQPSPDAESWVNIVKLCTSIEAIDEMKGSPEFRAFWSRATQMDRSHVSAAVDELKLNLDAGA